MQLMTHRYEAGLRPQGKPAFTLVEILIVIAIMVILATMVFTLGTGATQKARNAQARTHIEGITTALMQYKQRFREFPLLNTHKNAADVDTLYNCLVGRVNGGEPQLFNTGTGKWVNHAPLIDDTNYLFDDKNEKIVDPWGTPYVYMFAENAKASSRTWKSREYVLFSAGEDADYDTQGIANDGVFEQTNGTGNGFMDHDKNFDNIVAGNSN